MLFSTSHQTTSMPAPPLTSPFKAQTQGPLTFLSLFTYLLFPSPTGLPWSSLVPSGLGCCLGYLLGSTPPLLPSPIHSAHSSPSIFLMYHYKPYLLKNSGQGS